MAAKAPSAAVLTARAGRAGRAKESEVRWEWFLENVSSKVKLSMRARVTLVTNMLRDKVVKNISRPVTKGTGPLGGRVVTNRSTSGEFPKAETAQLMKDIFADIRDELGTTVGYVGTSLDYGVILELRRNRSFLLRTFNENRHIVNKILTGPIK